MKILKSTLILAALHLVMPSNALPVYGQAKNNMPNILWITSEDNSPFLPKPVEELYDTEIDPWEVNNLAGDPAYNDILDRMRAENMDWMADIRDVGLIPESMYSEYAGEGSMYDYMRSDDCPFDELLEAAETATLPEADLKAYSRYLSHRHPAMRYWGATGMLFHLDVAKLQVESLVKASKDKSSSVAVIAVEALYALGEKETALDTYIHILTDPDYDLTDRNFALNSIDGAHVIDPELQKVVHKFYEDNMEGKQGFARFNEYD